VLSPYEKNCAGFMGGGGEAKARNYMAERLFDEEPQ